ncbi:M48 family metallopeptidase [uncultured Litoreibacter sp.]|uniref:M48 family metallopeptidase n=1 Tax=uncultured Litoreibacter sp. TaxID=1392394 RepID=UPI002612A2D9|nr:M48 family metallopeptidase [uncultured Litoreibacter sp.]
MRDVLAGQVGQVSMSTRIAQGLSGIMLIVPFVLMIGGVVLCVLGFPNPLLLFFGGLIVAVGFYVRPRRPTIEGQFFTRDDLPELFSLTDQIAERLGGQPITKVQFGAEFNAHSVERVGERVLGIGFALWQILSAEERVALIAHEISHQVNGDQARTGILQAGLHSVAEWHALCGSSRLVDQEGYYLRESEAEDIFGRGIMWIFAAAFSQLWVLLTRLSFLDSQRAEYFADAIATRAAGREAVIGTLRKLSYMPLLHEGYLEMAPSLLPHGTAYFDQLCRHAMTPSEQVRAELGVQMAEEAHCVDMSHPPTVERINFLENLTDPQGTPIPYRAGIDAELKPIIEMEGVKMLQMLEVQ